MTNFEMIKSMSLEELAKFNLRYTVETQFDFDYDYKDSPSYYPADMLMTSDGITFYLFDEQEALKHEMQWLQSEVDE